jgi:hypothetical protein
LDIYHRLIEKDMPILTQMIDSKHQRDEAPSEPSDKPAPVLIGFRVVYVSEQTEGAGYPDARSAPGS